MTVATLTDTTDTADIATLSSQEVSDILSEEAGTIGTLFSEWQDATTTANAAQVQAGERLNIVFDLRSTLFTDSEGEELSAKGAKAAFAEWWQAEGLTKDFVSRSMKAAELANVIGEDAAAALNQEMVKKLLPVAFESTAAGNLRKPSVRQENSAKVLRKAEELADTEGREVAGRHIAKARNLLNIAPVEERDSETIVRLRTVIRTAKANAENPPTIDVTNVTEEDMAAMENWLQAARLKFDSLQAEKAEEAAEEDAAE